MTLDHVRVQALRPSEYTATLIQDAVTMRFPAYGGATR